jgi:hypothetical protein
MLLAEFQQLNEQKAAASARFVEAQLIGDTALANQMDDIVARVSFCLCKMCAHFLCQYTMEAEWVLTCACLAYIKTSGNWHQSAMRTTACLCSWPLTLPACSYALHLCCGSLCLA